MAVFKAYFKVMRGSALMLAISLSIFMGLALLFSFVAPGAAIQEFEPARTPVAVINRDGETPLARGVMDHLAANFKVVSLADDAEGLQDALFYRKVEYIAIIPSGFSESFIVGGSDPPLQKIVVPDSTSSRYVDLTIDRLLNTIRLHRVYGREESPARLLAAAREDLAFDTPVTMSASGGTHGYGQGYYYYFNYCAYALLAMIITGISSIMLAFNKPDLYRRNLAAPLSHRRMNLQIASGHSVFALGCWGLLLIFAFALHGKNLLGSGLVGLYALNTLAFALVSAAIGFLAGTFVKSRGAQAGVINATALGLSFLGGVFVPQAVMSKPVLAVARFLPTYWFIRANDIIGEFSSFTVENLGPVLVSIFIQLGFAAVIFSVTLLIGKERKVFQ